MPTTKRRPKRRSRPRRPTKKLRMTSPEAGSSLIERIDSRQNELLDQLAELNAKAEALLSEWTQTREDELQQAEPADLESDASHAGPGAPIFQSPAADAAPQEC